MLTRLRFKNFKAWKDSDEIRLAPITVLFGTNSAGKTSIPQLLLMLKQTAESPDRQRALHLGDIRTLVDLGTYDDIVYRHDINKPLEISLGWTLGSPLAVSDPLSNRKYEGNKLRFDGVFKADKRHQPLIHSFGYSLSDDDKKVLELQMHRCEAAKNSKQRNKNEFELKSSQYDLKRRQGRAWPLPHDTHRIAVGTPDGGEEWGLRRGPHNACNEKEGTRGGAELSLRRSAHSPRRTKGKHAAGCLRLDSRTQLMRTFYQKPVADARRCRLATPNHDASPQVEPLHLRPGEAH